MKKSCRSRQLHFELCHALDLAVFTALEGSEYPVYALMSLVVSKLITEQCKNGISGAVLARLPCDSLKRSHMCGADFPDLATI